MASEWHPIWNENTFDMQDIPTEDSTNSITSFSVNTSKLISDKGSIKQEDMIIFKHECANLLHNYTKFPIMKKLTMKQDWEESKLKRQFTIVKAQRMKQHRISTDKQKLQPKLSQIDSPCILKSILNSKEDNKWEKKYSDEDKIAKNAPNVDKLFNEEELGLISENSNSVSE